MKKHLPTIFIAILILVAGVLIAPHFVEAQAAGLSKQAVIPSGVGFFGGIAMPAVNSLLSYISYAILQVCAWFVAIGGTLLNLSVNITTHVKDLYDSTDGLKSVWVVVRDLTSMFIIFGLIYFSILTIIGKGGKKVNEFIVAIFIAGILINFSLFFARVLVDGSNLISLHIYNAISPNSSQNLTVGKAFQEGGIANVFMNSLKLPTIYNNTKLLKGADVTISIFIATVAGSIMMIGAGFSFFAASLAFIARTGILLFCMALSPLYFAAIVFPQLKGKAGELRDLFVGQLIFMPAYLFLMYIALKFITDPMFMRVFQTGSSGAADNQPFGAVSIGVAIQYTVAIIFINMPLIVAASLGGPSAKWAADFSNGLKNKLKGVVGRNTVGKGSKWLGGKFDSMAATYGQEGAGKQAATVLRALRISQAVRGKLTEGEKGKFGSNYNLSDLKEEDKKRGKEVRKVILKQDLEAALKSGNDKDIRDALGKMTDKEIADLGAKTLKDEKLIPHLSRGAYKAVDGSEKEDKEKVEIFEARAKVLNDTLGKTGKENAVRDIVKNMSGEELEAYFDSHGVKDEVVAHLKQGQLKDMENLEDDIRKQIGDKIANWADTHGGRNHPGWDHIKKNKTTWGQADEERGGGSSSGSSGGGSILGGSDSSPSGKRSSKSYG